ncbi:MAG: ECF-type sigma factor [Planctomycetaceae bacterium]
MSDVTQILQQIEAGDTAAAEQLLPLVYHELRRLAAARMSAESPDHTLQATALVHEAYLRLVGGSQPQQWNGRGHFFAAAAEAMRRILVESARSRQRLKRGGGHERIDLGEAMLIADQSPGMLLDIDEALSRLATEDAMAAQLVKLRFFAGLSIEECAAVLGMSRTVAYDQWAYARAWLRCALEPPPDRAEGRNS